jgi:hypothetical protein
MSATLIESLLGIFDRMTRRTGTKIITREHWRYE